MAENETKNGSKKILYVVIALIIVAFIGVAVYFLVFNKGVKNETITAENYKEVMEKVEKEFKKDDEDLYYLTYAMTYHMMKDGLSSALTEGADESAMYQNIYGKTVKELIDEGKQLMKDNNVTIDQFKTQLESMGNGLLQ